MRLVLRLLALVLAAYGPLAPLVVLFVLAMPPVILLSGWPLWLKALLLANDVGLLVGTALWLGPGMLEEVRQFLEEERRS